MIDGFLPRAGISGLVRSSPLGRWRLTAPGRVDLSERVQERGAGSRQPRPRAGLPLSRSRASRARSRRPPGFAIQSRSSASLLMVVRPTIPLDARPNSRVSPFASADRYRRHARLGHDRAVPVDTKFGGRVRARRAGGGPRTHDAGPPCGAVRHDRERRRGVLPPDRDQRRRPPRAGVVVPPAGAGGRRRSPPGRVAGASVASLCGLIADGRSSRPVVSRKEAYPMQPLARFPHPRCTVRVI